MSERWSSPFAGRDDPGLQERPRAGPHLGVVAGQEEVGPRPLQDGGGRRRRPPRCGPGWSGPASGRSRNVLRSWASGPNKGLVRAQIDAGQGAWVDAASEASWCRAATRSGPAVWGRRSSAWDWPTAPMPVRATCSGRAGEVLDRAELAAGDREDVDGPQQRGRQQTVRGAEVRLGRAEGPDRARRTGCRRPRGPIAPTAPPPRHGGCARPRPATSTTTATAQTTTIATTAAVIFRPSGEAPPPRTHRSARARRGRRRSGPRARRSSPRGAYCRWS